MLCNLCIVGPPPQRRPPLAGVSSGMAVARSQGLRLASVGASFSPSSAGRALDQGRVHQAHSRCYDDREALQSTGGHLDGTRVRLRCTVVMQST